jgi:hypothetical protein
MSYSRRQLEAFGEPLGGSVTRKEGGRIIYGGGGSGGGGQSTTTQDLPDWAKPYAQQSLAGAQSLVFQKDAEGNVSGLQPYQQYTGERTAQFTPLQKSAFEGAEALAPSASTAGGAYLAGQAGMQALNTSYKPSSISASSVGSSGYNAADMQAAQTGYNPQLQTFQMGPAERLSAQNFGNQSAQDYMSPYMQQVVDVQQREARRASEITRNQQQAQAVGQGAFGGSRQAIVEAERQRNLGTQLGDIQSQGLQSAFSQAQQQFNTDQARQMAAQQANQQAGLTVGQQNLAAQMGTQQLGTQTGLQTALANLTAAQQAEVNNQAAKNQAMGMSSQQALQAAIANQSASLQAQQISEQSRQFGAGLGLQGLQTALQGAGVLGSLGQQQFGQQKDVLGIQNQFGTQQQQQIQNMQNQQYQDFLAQQRYPYQQMEFLSSMVRGTPTGTVQSMYQPEPGLAQTVVGAGTALYGANQLTNRAKGGTVSSYAKGGAVKKKQKSAGLAELALSKI